LKKGSALPNSQVSRDSTHFLGCMALHESTPNPLLKDLAELGIPLVDAVLASRESSGKIVF
jgi:hypothetical protein